MQRGHELAVLHLQKHLAQAHHARRRLQMADVRLHRADRARPQGGPVTRERVGEPGDLDRIAQLGSGAVRLDVANAARVDAGLLERRGHQVALRLRIRHRVPAGSAAMVDHRALDHAVDVVAILERLLQRLDVDRADALAGDVTVATRAEGGTRRRSTAPPFQLMSNLCWCRSS
jgi:hypothetical protein